jgi:hypothetical protein
LRSTPGFFVTSVGTLALAIGAVAAMFSVVQTVLLKPLPFPSSDRLVALAGTAPGSDLPDRFGLGFDFYFHYKENSQLIDGVFAFGGGTSTLRTDTRVERIPMAFPTNDMYATLGIRPMFGRLPVPEDGDRVVLISHRLWDTWFGRRGRFFVGGRFRQQEPRLQISEPRRHHEVIGCNFDFQVARLVDKGEILVGERENRDFGEVDLLVTRERKQEVEGAFEAAHVHHERRALGEPLAVRQFEVVGFHH